MKIVSVLEDKKVEKRISITPEIAKKYITMGLEVSLSESYGEHLGFSDKEYKKLGVKISKDDKGRTYVQLGAKDDLVVPVSQSSLKSIKTFK